MQPKTHRLISALLLAALLLTLAAPAVAQEPTTAVTAVDAGTKPVPAEGSVTVGAATDGQQTACSALSTMEQQEYAELAARKDGGTLTPESPDYGRLEQLALQLACFAKQPDPNAPTGAGVLPDLSPSATVLVNSSFESGSFSGDGWTEVNGAQTNKWFVGTVAGASSGTNAAYISDDAVGATYNYNITSPSVVHFYRDVTFPAGETVINLTFDAKGIGESTFDYVRVFLVATSTTPVAGTLLASGQIGRGNYNGQAEYTRLASTSQPALQAQRSGLCSRGPMIIASGHSLPLPSTISSSTLARQAR